MARQIEADVLQVVGARTANFDLFHARLRMSKTTGQYTRNLGLTQTAYGNLGALRYVRLYLKLPRGRQGHDSNGLPKRKFFAPRL